MSTIKETIIEFAELSSSLMLEVATSVAPVFTSLSPTYLKGPFRLHLFGLSVLSGILKVKPNRQQTFKHRQFSCSSFPHASVIKPRKTKRAEPC
jgi:hypothetical protein